MNYVNEVESLYKETLHKLSTGVNLTSVDFLGLNFDKRGQIEFKIYSPPIYQSKVSSSSCQIEKYIYSNNMYRLTCVAHSLRGSRHYIVLKNKSKGNVKRLLNAVGYSCSWFGQYINQILSISEMATISGCHTNNSETGRSSQTLADGYSSIHMIGFKTFSSGDSAVNIEWLTRKMSCEDSYSSDYSYDDKYYLSFLVSMDDSTIRTLCKEANDLFFQEIENDELHIWLFASDYYKNSNCRFKLYFKCTEKTNPDSILSKLFFWTNCKSYYLCNSLDESNAYDQRCCEIESFIHTHESLKLYGFALGMSSIEKSINLYFTQN